MQPSSQLRRIAVIGAGSAGRDFALRCARAGFDVILEDVMPSRLRSAHQTFEAEAPSGTLHLASTVEDAVRNADLAIDFVPDELESKLEIFSMLDRMAPPRTILCTPTSTLSIADLASCTYRSQLCFALRFPSADSAELIHTVHSAPEALAAVQYFLRTLGYSLVSRTDPLATDKLTTQN